MFYINNNNSISKNGIVVLTEGIIIISFDISDAEIALGNNVRKSQATAVIVNGNPHASYKCIMYLLAVVRVCKSICKLHS